MPRSELLRIFAHHAQNSAVGWYRIIQPTRAITKQKLARVVTIDFRPGEPLTTIKTDELDRVIQWADVALFSQLDNPVSLATAGSIKMTYNIPLLMELDDLPMELNDDSWAFSQYRQDNPMGGADASYWALKQMQLSDGIIVTNEYLKMRVEKLLIDRPSKRVWVMPNTVDVGLFKNRPNKTITIGWQGGSNHVRDLELVRPAILRILKENPLVRFQTFGYQPAWTVGARGCKHERWVTFDKYYKTLGNLGLTIGIAPLVDNAFDRCKSNLRWLEYSALGIPTVASPVGPYQCIRNNATGLYAHDEHGWYTTLTALIKRPKTRARIATNALRTVRRSYSPYVWAKRYVQCFNFYAAKFARSAREQHLPPAPRTPTPVSFS